MSEVLIIITVYFCKWNISNKPYQCRGCIVNLPHSKPSPVLQDHEDYNSTYEELLHIAKVPSLQIRRMRTMALECFKILYKLSPPCLNDLVVLKNNKIVLDILIL